MPIIALSLFSCSDYLDVNSSPNNAVGSQVTPNLALAAAQTNTYRTLARTGNVFGNLMLNNWGYNVNSFAVTSPEEFTLAYTNNTYAGIWDGFYVATANFSNIINHPDERYSNHKAIAKICKSYYFQYLVDMYGDIPYYDVHQGSDNLSPAYDDDQAVYRDLVVQIEEAIEMIQNPAGDAIAVGGEDAVMNGDMAKWVQFGNTLKMRLLLRQSEMNDGETQSYITSEFAELASASFITEDVTINPGYDNTRDDRQNPYYNLFFEVNGDEKQSSRLYRASEYFALQLEGSPKDPRRFSLFESIGGQVVGVRQGDASQVGGGTAPTTISKIGPGVIISPTQDGYMMTLAEGLLLHAEAVHRGYLAGSAQALFDQAILASIAQVGGTAGTYVTDINTVLGKGYGAFGATSRDQLRAIMYQKNVAVSATNAMEVYIEFTRTGFIDEIPLVAAVATKPNRPRKLLYPNSEYVGNSANVPQQTADEIFTSGAFWYSPN